MDHCLFHSIRLLGIVPYFSLPTCNCLDSSPPLASSQLFILTITIGRKMKTNNTGMNETTMME